MRRNILAWWTVQTDSTESLSNSTQMNGFSPFQNRETPTCLWPPKYKSKTFVKSQDQIKPLKMTRFETIKIFPFNQSGGQTE